MLLPVILGLPTISANAVAAPVGQGFTVTPSDLAYILKQIKIAETHVANTTSTTGLCGALRDQLASPLVSFGLRTVDGSCNNLQAGQDTNGAADQVFPRLATPVFKTAESNPPVFGPAAGSSYDQTSGSVFDTQPRTVSNLIVDQTSTNPAAIAAAGFPVRTQGNPGVVPCTVDPDPLAAPPVVAVPLDCTPSHQTLFMPNVTTDVGLSPPYNSLFTLFGQFFDHGIDQTVKGGSGTVFVPLNADDPLVTLGPDGKAGTGDEVVAPKPQFMALTRGTNQPGPDKILGTADDIRDTVNTDSPWVDQSQTYTSHPSHQAFLREYVLNDGLDGIAGNADDRPVATGKLLGGVLPAGAPAGQDSGMATWATTKLQAAEKLGLLLTDKDVTDIPMLLVDAYGKFVPGPAHGLPQYVTRSTNAAGVVTNGLLEGNRVTPVAVPANVVHFDTPFLTDIAHSAAPTAGGPDSNLVAGKQLDTPVPAGSFDNELLDSHFIAGDGRVNENIGLTSIHQVFHSEHDRLVTYIEDVLTKDTTTSGVTALKEWKLATGAAGWNGERLFQAARFVTEMEYQHLVFEEFARKVQPAINPFEPFAFTQTDLSPAIRAEFAHAVYRFGHSMLTETISRTNENGSTNDISLLDGFLNPASYTEGGTAGTLTAAEAAGSVIMGMSDQVGNELDEFVTETLRNNLLGLPLDLPATNMARARSEGIPPLNVFRRQLFNATHDGQLTPYTSWVDYGENIKHPESLINFVAAYGLHPTITGATTLAAKRAAAKAIVNPVLGAPVLADAADFMNGSGTWLNRETGLNNIDLWVGGLAENTTPFGGLLGTTFNYVFENQMTDLQNGDRLYYLARTPGMNLRTQLEGNSFAELMMRNTNVHTLKADAFATADCKFQLGNLAGTPAGFAAGGNAVTDDAASECDESALLIRQPDGTIQYRAVNSIDPPGINGQAVYNGTPGVDRIRGGNDNDTFWGGLSNDVIEGGAGADIALGGEGNDIITDLAGDDVPKGGPGNDAIDAGPGLDIIMGGEGKDFTNGGANANETFGGADDDFIMLGESLDAAFGDSGDDWEEGGNQPDLMQGDSGNLFFLDDSQKPGSDILIGQGGDDDYDMEGGDDIGVGGPGIEKVAGASGYDWEIGIGDPQPQDMDLNVPLIPLNILQAGVRDKFNEVEALSGGDLNDILRGDDIVPSAVGGGGFIGCDVLDQSGLDRIAGLDPLVPTLATSLTSVVAASASKDCPILGGTNVWGDGNILLGGGGNDLIEGRGADDIIDGDRYLNVRLSVRNAAGAEIGSATVNKVGQSAMTGVAASGNFGPGTTGMTLQQAVFAGLVNPGNIVAVREVISGAAGIDTAVFSGPEANYTVNTSNAAGATVALGSPNSVTTVVDTTGTDGTDTLRNVEALRFSDTPAAVAPLAPVIGVATAGIASATVSFTPPAGVLTGFRVEASTGTAATGFTVVSTTTVTNGAATSAVVSPLTPGIPVTFRVAAVNGVGTGAFSARTAPVTPRAADVVAPTVTARTPAAGSFAASRLNDISATLSEPVVAITGANFTLRRAGTLVAAVVGYNATTRVTTLNPNATLAADTTYTATLSGVRDLAGNPMATTTWSFTTGPAPTIGTISPAPNATGVIRNTNVTAQFSEFVTGLNDTSVRLTRVTTGAILPIVRTFNTTTNVLTINPSVTLQGNAQYRVTITGGPGLVRDSVGNPLLGRTWVFTTRP